MSPDLLWGSIPVALVLLWVFARARLLKWLGVLWMMAGFFGPMYFKAKARAHTWAFSVICFQLVVRVAYLSWYEKH